MYDAIPEHTRRTLIDDVPFPHRPGRPAEFAHMVRAVIENPMMNGAVVRIEPKGDLKVPHMGWNTLSFATPHMLLEGIPDGEQGLHAYFVHSYHLATDNRATLLATSDYGQAVTAIVGRDNLIGWMAGR